MSGNGCIFRCDAQYAWSRFIAHSYEDRSYSLQIIGASPWQCMGADKLKTCNQQRFSCRERQFQTSYVLPLCS